jgi:hypothetical protein
MFFAALLALLMPVMVIMLAEALITQDPVTRRMIILAFSLIWSTTTLLFLDWI